MLFGMLLLGVVWLLLPFDVSEWMFGAAGGVFLFAWGYLWGREELLELEWGLALIAAGAAAVVTEWFIAERNTLGTGVFMAWLTSLGWMRHLPLLAALFASLGATIVLACLVRRLRRLDRRAR